MPVAEAVARPLAARFDPNATDFARITLQELVAMLLETKRATILTLTAWTVPDYRKTADNPFTHRFDPDDIKRDDVGPRRVRFKYADNLMKLARVNGMMNWNYERAVNTQRAKEGLPQNFNSLPRWWGTHMVNTPFIGHVCKDGQFKIYLKFKVREVLNVQYNTVDGTPIPTEEVEPFLTERERNYRQGVLKEVVERDYTVSNLLAVVHRKMGYIVT